MQEPPVRDRGTRYLKFPGYRGQRGAVPTGQHDPRPDRESLRRLPPSRPAVQDLPQTALEALASDSPYGSLQPGQAF
jgi:hypothetical protein